MNAALDRLAARRLAASLMQAALLCGSVACTQEASRTPPSPPAQPPTPATAPPTADDAVAATPPPLKWVPKVAPPAPAAPPEPVLFAEETMFVATEQANTYQFTLNRAVEVRLTVELEEKVPLTVVVLPGRIPAGDYLLALTGIRLGQVFALFGDRTAEKPPSVGDLFTNRLSRQSAYGRYVSPWVALDPGPYTVIFDNSGEIAPTRGDAPLRLQLHHRPAS